MALKSIIWNIITVVSLLWIGFMVTYSAFITGSLFHELNHLTDSKLPALLTVNIDGSGSVKSEGFVNYDHNRIYFNGFMLELTIMIVSVLALLVVIKDSKF